jgi:hypothetical protein
MPWTWELQCIIGGSWTDAAAILARAYSVSVQHDLQLIRRASNNGNQKGLESHPRNVAGEFNLFEHLIGSPHEF